MKKQNANEIEDMQDERLNERLNRNEKLIVKYLVKNEKITNKQATDLIGLSSAQVRRIFVSLQDKGLIEGHGKNKFKYYILVEQ